MRTTVIAGQSAILLALMASASLGEDFRGVQDFFRDDFAVFTVWSEPIEHSPVELSIDYALCNFDLKNGALVYNWETAGLRSASNAGLPPGLCNVSSLPVKKVTLMDGDSIEFTQAKRHFGARIYAPEETLGQHIEGLAKSIFKLFSQQEGQEIFRTLNIEFSIVPGETTTEYVIDWNSNDVTIAIPQKVFEKLGGEEMRRITGNAKVGMQILPLRKFNWNEGDLSESEIDESVVAFTRSNEFSQPLSFNIPLGGARYSREKMYVIENNTNRIVQSLTYMGAAYE